MKTNKKDSTGIESISESANYTGKSVIIKAIAWLMIAAFSIIPMSAILYAHFHDFFCYCFCGTYFEVLVIEFVELFQ